MIRGGYWGGSWGLSWGGTWGEAWLLLNQPYQELSLKGQVFVRSYLSSIHSVEVAEQIVSVAALNNLSIVDSALSLSAKHRVDYVDVIRKVSVSKPPKAQADKTSKRVPKQSVFAQHRQPSISAKTTGNPIDLKTQAQSVNIINNQFSIACTYKAD